MKKNLLTIIIAFISLSLCAKSIEYNSNALSQRLGSYDGSSKYKLVVLESEEGSTTSLFLDNKLIQSTIAKIDDNYKVVSTTENNESCIKTYKDNLLIKSVCGDITITNTYQDTRLISKAVKKNNKLIEFTRFYYAGNTLSAILRQIGDDSSYSMFRTGEINSLLISENDNFREIDVHGTLMSSQVFEGEQQLLLSKTEALEDGSIIISSTKNNKETKEYYNSEGFLYKKELFDENQVLVSTLEIVYDGDWELEKEILVENIKSRDDLEYDIFTKKSTINYYNKGKISKIEIYENDVLISSSIYNLKGQRVEKLYKDGSLYCSITYALDDKKILDIVYE